MSNLSLIELPHHSATHADALSLLLYLVSSLALLAPPGFQVKQFQDFLGSCACSRSRCSSDGIIHRLCSRRLLLRCRLLRCLLLRCLLLRGGRAPTEALIAKTQLLSSLSVRLAPGASLEHSAYPEPLCANQVDLEVRILMKAAHLMITEASHCWSTIQWTEYDRLAIDAHAHDASAASTTLGSPTGCCQWWRHLPLLALESFRFSARISRPFRSSSSMLRRLELAGGATCEANGFHVELAPATAEGRMALAA